MSQESECERIHREAERWRARLARDPDSFDHQPPHFTSNDDTYLQFLHVRKVDPSQLNPLTLTQTEIEELRVLREGMRRLIPSTTPEPELYELAPGGSLDRYFEAEEFSAFADARFGSGGVILIRGSWIARARRASTEPWVEIPHLLIHEQLHIHLARAWPRPPRELKTHPLVCAVEEAWVELAAWCLSGSVRESPGPLQKARARWGEYQQWAKDRARRGGYRLLVSTLWELLDDPFAQVETLRDLGRAIATSSDDRALASALDEIFGAHLWEEIFPFPYGPERGPFEEFDRSGQTILSRLHAPAAAAGV